VSGPLVLAVLVSAPFILLLLTKPVLRRTAWRNAAQRPREAVLVAMGSLLGAAIITGSFIVGDTFDHSLERRAYSDLGPVDEVVAFRDRASWEEGSLRLEPLRLEPPFDGLVPMGFLTVPVSSTDAPPRPAPEAQLIEVSFERARELGPTTVSGIEGATPGPGEAAISTQLSERIGVGPGDGIRAYAYGRTVDLRVVRVLPQVGVAGFRLGPLAVADNVLVAPGTVQELVSAAEGTAGFELVSPRWLVAVSNMGGVESGVGRTDEAVERLRRSLQGIDNEVLPAKRDALESALTSGAGLSQFLNAMGAFGVLAGILLMVNVFVMMGEERSPELGSMRAVGMTRGAVVATFSTEGWIYSLAGCLVGAAAGVGLGRVMVALVSRLYQPETEVFGFALHFFARRSSVEQGFAGGLAISVVTVVLTSVRIGRLDVIQALRSLPPGRKRRPRSVVVVGLAAVLVTLAVLMTLAGFASHAAMPGLLGPVFLMIGLVPLFNRAVATRTAVSVATAGIVLWAAVGFSLVGPTPDDALPIVLQGLTMVAAAVVLITLQQHQVGKLLRRTGRGRRGVTARIALAYPLARPVRTALTLAPVCLVVFTLAFVASLATLITSDVKSADDRAGGRYDLVLDSSAANPVPVEDLRFYEGVDAIAPLSNIPVAYVATASNRPLAYDVAGFDVAFAQGGAPRLDDRGAYPTDEAVWKAVYENPGLTIVDPGFLGDYEGEEEVGVMSIGRTITIVDPVTARARELQIAGLAGADIAFNGAFIGKPGLDDLVGGRAVTNRLYIDLSGDPAAFAKDVTTRYVANGASVETFEELGQNLLDFIVQLVNIYWTYLGVGLVAGVAGIAVMMVRAVRERRRQVGVLRSLGFEAGMVGRAFALEALFVALEAVVLGIGLAVATVYTVAHSDTISDFLGQRPTFVIATVSLSLLGGGTVIAALLATVGPARSASRIPPSEALRLLD
jgi:putative ABC transport system permease protein